MAVGRAARENSASETGLVPGVTVQTHSFGEGFRPIDKAKTNSVFYLKRKYQEKR